MTKVALYMLVISAACSKSGSDTSSDKSSAARPAPEDTTQLCDRKLVTAADVAGILTEPITGTKPIERAGCELITATHAQGGPGISVTFRPTNGKATIAMWRSGKMGSEAEPLAGVGDDAVWVSALKEVDVTKSDALCVVALSGSALIGHYGADLPAKLAAVCTKLFANAKI
jgi:hypothetical protein